jgi:hypothetical protein
MALVLAIGGGTVYAASQLGKNDVRTRNIAPGAVKKADLGKNAVTSPKVNNRTIRRADIAPGVIPNVVAKVTGSATGGPQPVPNTDTPNPVPLTGTTTFTPQPGTVAALALEAQFTMASTGVDPCSAIVRLFVNGEPASNATASPPSTSSTTPVTQSDHGADGPFGLVNPGTPITITAGTFANDCSPDTRLDRVEVRIVQIR